AAPVEMDVGEGEEGAAGVREEIDLAAVAHALDERPQEARVLAGGEAPVVLERDCVRPRRVAAVAAQRLLKMPGDIDRTARAGEAARHEAVVAVRRKVEV